MVKRKTTTRRRTYRRSYSSYRKRPRVSTATKFKRGLEKTIDVAVYALGAGTALSALNEGTPGSHTFIQNIRTKDPDQILSSAKDSLQAIKRWDFWLGSVGPVAYSGIKKLVKKVF